MAVFPGYAYAAAVVEVHDGDTCMLDMDLGFWVTVRMACRLSGLNARELGMPGGPEAGRHLAGLIPVGAAVVVQSVAPDKYAGRFDGVVWLRAAPAPLVSVNEQMIADGFAAPWNGTGPKPVPPWPLPAG